MSEHHVGAKPLPLPNGVVSQAAFGGPAECYRYRLEWSDESLYAGQGTIMWLMMNPSVASHECGDRTVLRCWDFSRRWGYQRMLVGNSMAYRATDQARLAEVEDPVGWMNHTYLLEMAREADMVILAYGKPKVRKGPAAAAGQDAAVYLRQHGIKTHALRLSADGTPCHPLYLPGDLKPFEVTP